jgi:CheY-like chemotaxis protein
VARSPWRVKRGSGQNLWFEFLPFHLDYGSLEEDRMRESILDGKRILAVDDEPDVLDVLEEEIVETAPKCKFEKATTYQGAVQKLRSETYDVVILDIMGVRGFDLLDLSAKRNLTVAMLTAHSLNPESLKRSIEKKARAYLPKDKLGEIVPFLECILEEEYLPGWERLMKKLEKYFNSKWGRYWKKSEESFWRDFNKRISPKRRNN